MLLLTRRYHPRPRLMQATLMSQVPIFMAILLATRGPSGMRAPLWAIADYRSDRFGKTLRPI
jgi:hypothetical protein